MTATKLESANCTPAYGRTYKTAKEAEADFRKGKDFRFHSPHGSSYGSIRDCEKGATIEITYTASGRKTAFIL